MRSIAMLALVSALGCAGMSSSSSPQAAQRSDAQSCASPQVPAVVERDSEVYARPDPASGVIGNLGTKARVCADAEPSGYGYRRVKLADGRNGYVDDAHVSLM